MTRLLVNLIKRLLRGGQRACHYAHINQDGVCTSVWRLDRPSEHAHAVPIDSLDAMLIGKKWDGRRWLQQAA